MAKIKSDLVGVVYLRVDGRAVYLSAGDEVPAGVELRDDLLEGGAMSKPDAGVSERPKANAKKADWVTYYEALTGESADGMTVDEIIAAVD